MKHAYILAAPLAAICSPAMAAEIVYTGTGTVNGTFQFDFPREDNLFVPIPGPEFYRYRLEFSEPIFNAAIFTVFKANSFGNFFDDPQGRTVFTGSVSPEERLLFFRVRGTTLTPATYSVSIDFRAVPEPSTWALLVLGFGAIGYAMRARRKVSVSYA